MLKFEIGDDKLTCAFLRAGCRLTLAWMLLTGSAIVAQQPTIDAPSTSAASAGTLPATSTTQPDALQVVAKRSKFFPNLATDSNSMTSGEKFKLFVNNSISGAALVGSLASAGFGQAIDSNSDYGQGGEGFAKRFGAAMATNATSNFVGTWALASVLHQDPRFFVSGKQKFRDRVRYASRRLFIIRTDSGGEAFNWSGLMGPLAAEGVANTYLPESERTAGDTFKRYGVDVAIQLGSNILREYWPSIFKKLRMPNLAPQVTTAPPPDH
jgi:hypothetical protein